MNDDGDNIYIYGHVGITKVVPHKELGFIDILFLPSIVLLVEVHEIHTSALS